MVLLIHNEKNLTHDTRGTVIMNLLQDSASYKGVPRESREAEPF